MPQFKYAGDRSADYHHDTGTGLVGKVMGPNLEGQYFVVTSAEYDAESDQTIAHAELLLDPRRRLAEMQAAQ